MAAPFELANTWLLERMYTRPNASRTRAPMVPAVIAGCPAADPICAVRWRGVRTLTMGATPGFKTENGRATSMGPGGPPGKARGVNGITRFWVGRQERCRA